MPALVHIRDRNLFYIFLSCSGLPELRFLIMFLSFTVFPVRFKMQIFVHKTLLMQRMSIYFANGYHQFIQGEIHAAKAESFANKMMSRFDSHLGETQRWRRRKEKKANSFFLIHPTYQDASFNWWLLLTDGDHPEKHEEKTWKDVRTEGSHLTVFGQYEAVKEFPSFDNFPENVARVMREQWKARPATAKNDPAWSWRMTPALYADYETRIRDVIRRKVDSPSHLIGVFTELRRLPGFRLIRAQEYALREYAANEWWRIKSAGEPLPTLPPVGGYVRFQKAIMSPLSVVVRRLLDGLPPYPDDLLRTYSDDVVAAVDGATP